MLSAKYTTESFKAKMKLIALKHKLKLKLAHLFSATALESRMSNSLFQ